MEKAKATAKPQHRHIFLHLRKVSRKNKRRSSIDKFIGKLTCPTVPVKIPQGYILNERCNQQIVAWKMIKDGYITKDGILEKHFRPTRKENF